MAKSIIVCESLRYGNTKKIADAMASVLGAKVVKTSEIGSADPSQYDLIGFGSGIMGWKHEASLLKFAERLPNANGTKVFVFSTSGSGNTSNHKKLNAIMTLKGYRIVGEFSCRGFDQMPYLGFIAKIFAPNGINIGKPDSKDIENAKEFAKKLKS